MTDLELAEIIQGLRSLGTDHADVEAKASHQELPKRIWETISAFANTSGGVIILGLDEKSRFSACGVIDAKKAQQDLASLCDQMQPEIRAQIRLHSFEGKTLVVAEVPEIPLNMKPCFYKGAGQINGAFTRVGDGDRKLTAYEVQLMVSSRGQPRDDEEIIEDATTEDFDRNYLSSLLTEVRKKSANLSDGSDEEILISLKAVKRHNGRLFPTLAGLLTLMRHPQRFFPALEVRFVMYPSSAVGDPGDGGERFLDNRKIEGSIPIILQQSLNILRQHMTRKTFVRGAKREDVWQYPETALREAIVNALVHRDLSSAARGTPVQIQMFSDKLIILNPGGLFGPVTIDSLGLSGISASRNSCLVRILEDLPGPQDGRPICENRGSGIGAMISALTKAGMEPPRFEDKLSSFQVTFPNTSLLDGETIAWLSRFGIEDLSDTQKMCLAMLHHGDYLDNTKYRQATGLDSRDATRELRELVNRGIIEQIGTRKWTTYRLVGGGETRRDRRAEIISLLKRKGELSRAEIAVELAISDSSARQWLTILRREKSVQLTGPARSPSVRYRITKAKGRNQK